MTPSRAGLKDALWGKPEDYHQSGGDEDGAVHQESRGQEQLLELDDLANRLLLWT